MSKDDWFRNTKWTDAIAHKFEEKLRRARDKSQYLRIQACTLASSHPAIALRLLDRYFQLPDAFDQAQARVDQATALSALGNHDDAARALEAALAREAQFPNLLTEAYVELPFLIATHRLAPRYDQALAILGKHESRLTFPVDHFRWHAAHALIFHARRDPSPAADHARLALRYADVAQSGLRHHPTIGLVTTEYDALCERLREVCAA